MLMTPERIAANQANAKHSSGPKTDAGKAASSRNAIKHGLTGAGIALPDEDAIEVEAAFDRRFEEMKPKTQAGAAIVFTLALNTLRLDRFATAEAATLSQRVIDAGFAFDDSQFARRDECRAKILKDPEAQLAILARFKVGVEWVIEAWDALGCALFSRKIKNWQQPQFALFEALCGHSPEFPSYDDTTMWALAAKGDAGALDNPDLPGNTPGERLKSARDLLIAFCEAESARWETFLEPATAATAVARDNAIKAARYDGSKEGLLAKKYAAATTRELTKAYKDFPVVEAAYAEVGPFVETPVTAQSCAEVGSFFPESDTLPDADATATVEPEAMIPLTAQTFQTPISDQSAPTLNPILTVETGESRRL